MPYQYCLQLEPLCATRRCDSAKSHIMIKQPSLPFEEKPDALQDDNPGPPGIPSGVAPPASAQADPLAGDRPLFGRTEAGIPGAVPVVPTRHRQGDGSGLAGTAHRNGSRPPHGNLVDWLAAATRSPAASQDHQNIANGEKSKARDIIAAIRTLQQVEREKRPATQAERELLARFPGFGCVALSIFPNPVTGQYKDDGWSEIGEELKGLLSPAEYDSAKRTTFNAFYTSSTVIKAMYQGLKRLGVPDNGLTLEPGCGPGRFLYLAPKDMRFIAVELDSISGRIAKVLHPQADIRIEDFQNTRLPQLDAVIGNVPFADIPFHHGGQRCSLHDGFLAKSVDALAPGGVLALITSRYMMDKQNAAIREYIASKADFIGAIRLPSDAFKKEGTSVVTDIVFLRNVRSTSLQTTPIRTG